MRWSEVSVVVTRIGQLLVHEAQYLWGIEDQLKRLQTELKWMQSFLIDADAKKAEDERIRLWISEVRKLACYTEDVIDTFALTIAYRRKGGVANFARKSVCIIRDCWRLHKVRSEIEDIMTKVSDLTRRLQTYGVKGLSNVGEGSNSFAERQDSRRRPYPHIIEDNIVGLDNEIKKLLPVLVGDDGTNECQVVSICGMGGLGKTTLAKGVYHHGQVRSHFKHISWNFVSQQFQRNKIWEDILSSFGIMGKEGMRKMRDEEIAEKLCNFLKENKCLVILDDIWTIEAWDSLKAAFPLSGTPSKILLTSRNKEVVSHADKSGHMHELQCLTDKESWQLLQKIAFLDQRNPPDSGVDARLEELGKAMVKSCAGLPLAIVVLGGILSQRNSLYEWQKVSEHVKSYLNRNKGSGVEHVLAMSYDDLPPYLKPCFLYLAHFPEDYEIDVDLLIQLWVAEGIVSEKDEKSGGEMMEDVAECYIVELAQRCMIQVGEKDATFKIVTCRMHDLMRELCLSKAEEENFLCIIDHTSQFISTPIARRIVAHKPTPPQCIKGSHLRSILFFDDPFDEATAVEAFLNSKMLKHLEEHEDDPDLLSWILFVFLICKVQGCWTRLFKNFKLLRVLHFFGYENDFAGIKLPSAIGNLIHLRFLSLRDFEFIWPKIPSSLGHLRCLQTLDLRVEGYGDFNFSVYVPNVIWKLEQLRHLYLPHPWGLKQKSKLKLDTLKNLQTLVNFNTRYCCAVDLSKLINLTKLEIIESFNIEDLDDSSPIIKSKRIRHLFIDTFESFETRNVELLLSGCLTICELGLSATIRKLPEYHHFPSTIAYVLLGRCHLAEDPMPILEKLPNLRILEIESEAFMGNKMVCSAQGFPKLDSLCFRLLKNLEEWNVDGEGMPSLRHLEIRGCENLKMLPEGLSSITTLRELKIIGMPKEFKDKLVEGGDDFRKVQHVPSIII